ncbi:MAG: ferrous iron transport protein B, partial [Lentisphaerae bacterium]|nr:ferrous iron transport protein B [Lentisphaerota bacterium]
RQHVGNYPGVTVERKTGLLQLAGMEIELIDLPGIYSLSSSSPEERVAYGELTEPGIDLVLNVVDSTVLQRSLYLTTQLAELRLPMLLVFNMSDEAESKGMQFDLAKLESHFGTKIVQTVGSRGRGVDALRDAIAGVLNGGGVHERPVPSCGAAVDDAIATVTAALAGLQAAGDSHIPARFFAIKLLEHDSAVMAQTKFAPLLPLVEEQLAHLRQRHAIEPDTFMADCRYAMLAGACRDAVRTSRERRREISDRIDVVMTNRLVGLPLFFLIMYVTFWFTFTCAAPLMAWIESGFGMLADVVLAAWPAAELPILRALVVDGVISGVGGVIVFLPNILLLFLAIAFLEDSGYMARAAFVMDGVMRRFGLHGKSFVPLVLGFGCSVPAIMATRGIESAKDRQTTIMVLPLMSCGARLPIYSLIIPAFFAARYQALMMWLIYAIGVVIALVAAWLMKTTLFKGDSEVYLMELPPYRLPTVKSIMLHMWDRGVMYLQKAGTIILATSIILFFVNTYPEKSNFAQDYDALHAQVDAARVLSDAELTAMLAWPQWTLDQRDELRQERQLTDSHWQTLADAGAHDTLTDAQQAVLTRMGVLENESAAIINARQAESLAFTISGRIGKTLEPFFQPIGFDWKVTTASIGALAAKEIFVSQLGILYSVGEADEESTPLREHLRRNYTPLQGFCIMLFSLLSIPCLATLAVIRRELNSWRMAALEAVALFTLAYVVTLLVYQVGTLLAIGSSPLA